MSRSCASTRRRQLLLAAAACAALPAGALAQPAGAAANPAAHPASSAAAAGKGKRLPRLTLAGPFATVSFPLIRMVESGALADVAEEVRFVSWKNPDQLRAMAVNQSADFLAMPSNVAANLYNKGVPLRLLSITTWGILWVVSRDPELRRMEQLRGRELVMPFKGDMPDITFRLLAQHAGLDPDRDITLRPVGTPLEAMQLLLTRRADQAVLAEPAVSMGLRKSQSLPASVIAPALHRSIDLQEEWGRLLKRPARIPQAGVVVLGAQRDNAALTARFQQAHAEATAWCLAHPQACGDMVVKHVDALTPQAVADALAQKGTEFVPARQARAELEFFYQQFVQQQKPALIGGRLPADDFYGA